MSVRPEHRFAQREPDRKGGVKVAGGLRNQIQHSSLLVVAPGGQMCFVKRSSRLGPLRTTGPLSRQSLARNEPGESPCAQHQSGGRDYGDAGDTVEQLDLARRTRARA